MEFTRIATGNHDEQRLVRLFLATVYWPRGLVGQISLPVVVSRVPVTGREMRRKDKKMT